MTQLSHWWELLSACNLVVWSFPNSLRQAFSWLLQNSPWARVPTFSGLLTVFFRNSLRRRKASGMGTSVSSKQPILNTVFWSAMLRKSRNLGAGKRSRGDPSSPSPNWTLWIRRQSFSLFVAIWSMLIPAGRIALRNWKHFLRWETFCFNWDSNSGRSKS